MRCRGVKGRERERGAPMNAGERGWFTGHLGGVREGAAAVEAWPAAFPIALT